MLICRYDYSKASSDKLSKQYFHWDNLSYKAQKSIENKYSWGKFTPWGASIEIKRSPALAELTEWWEKHPAFRKEY